MWLCSASSRLSFIFLLFAALVPRPAYYQLPVEGPDHPARPAHSFRWRMMPVATDMFRSYDAASEDPSIPKEYPQKKSSNLPPWMEPEKDIVALHLNPRPRSRKNTFCRTDRKTRPLPLGGRQAARFLDGLTRKPVRNSVVLPVNMTYGPGTASKSEGFP